MSRFSCTDLLAASAPLLGSITLADVNSAAQILGSCLGTAFLVWKWRREARGKKSAARAA